ncbi:hypothetical protein V498_05887 [Pseudogymnoascus sp. VKM F-4517 (FW-2822)]|nr:hypothetical protein V498_05887 [Pseudogymnoascus sp. VKM F-4517 (FW-2822)]
MEMQHILDDRQQGFNSQSGSVEQAPRRLKNKLACQECRDRKIRCDGRRPVCRSCLRKKLPPERCLYSTHSPIDNNVARDDSYTRALENRILELESSHGHSPRIASVPTPTSAQHTEHQSGTGNSPPYLGRASAAFGRGTVVPEVPESSPSSWFGDKSKGDQDSVVLGIDLVLPPRRTADILLRSYWIGAHPLLPIIHKSAFLTRYERIWSGAPPSLENNREESSRQSELVFHFMLNIIFALGCRFISISGQGQLPGDLNSKQPFFDRAMKLMTLDLLEDGSIELVQSLLITVQYIQTLELSNKGWVILGMAIRLAQSIGIHLDVGRESQAKREERRRAWCVCILLDRLYYTTTPGTTAGLKPEKDYNSLLQLDAQLESWK